MRPAIAYIATLLTFCAVDFVWLRVMASRLYLPTLGDMLLDEVRIAPAIVFYLLYPLGLVVFVVLPALKSDSVASALGFGALFGLIAYATYDLTNYATLKNWSFTITAADMAYGGFASALATAAAFAAARWLTSN
ncbi:MAG: DUF2177 family protein [Pseudorhodoplanes sp.]